MAGLEIEPVDSASQRESLATLLLQYLTPYSSPRRCQWFYEENPHGKAEVLVLRDSASGAIVGSGAVIPRQVWVDGEQRPATLMADFWIHPNHRALGPAVQLQRACVERALALGFAFYDLPQGNMPAVYRRMRLLGTRELVRLARPLRAGPFISRLVPARALAAPAAWIGDALLRFVDSVRAKRGDLSIAIHEGAFGPEFDELAARSRPPRGVAVARSAHYLQWRYRCHYRLEYVVFSARSTGRLSGYAVVVVAGEYAEVVDIFPSTDPVVAAALLVGVARAMRERGAAGLAVSWLAGTGPFATLIGAGLRERSRRPFVIHEFAGGDAAAAASGEQPREWLLAYGDIDY